MATRSSYERMLRAAGFAAVDRVDITARFRDTQAAWMNAVAAQYDQLVALEGMAAVKERQRDQRVQLRAIDEGLLQRAIFSASA